MYLKTVALSFLCLISITTELPAQAKVEHLNKKTIVVPGYNNSPPFEFIGGWLHQHVAMEQHLTNKIIPVEDIKQRINLKASGEYDKIYSQWFGSPIDTATLSSILYYSIVVILVLFLLTLAIVYVLKRQIRMATDKLSRLNNDLRLSLKAGEVSAWTYNISNQTIRSLYGSTCAGSGILFTEFTENIHPDDACSFIEFIAQIKSGQIETASLLMRYQMDDGSYHYYESEMIGVKDGKKSINLIIGTQKDVTLKQSMKDERTEVSLALTMAIKTTSLYVWHYHVAEGCFYELKNYKFVKTQLNHNTMKAQLHPDDVANYEYIFSLLTQGKEETSETVFRILNKNTNQYHYFESYLTGIKDERGRVCKIAINQRDITKKHLIKLEIENAYKSLDMAMSVAGLIAWEYCLHTHKYQILYGNDFYQQNTNHNLDFIHPEDRDLFTNSAVNIATGNSQKETITIRLKREDDSYGYFESTMANVINGKGEVISLLGALKDITIRKQAELSIIKTNQLMEVINRKNELILNNTNAGLAFIRTDYIVEWENISICSASLSYEAYKQGEKCYESAHNRKTPCEDCVFQRVIASRQVERIDFELESGHYIEIFATPVFNEDQSIEGIVIRLDDISERRRKYLELAQAKEKAEASDRLKSAFLANMSHEIRTPLNAIVGFSELILTTDNKQERDEYIQIVKKNNELLLQLIGDILELSKIEAGYLKVTLIKGDLASSFNDLAHSIEPLIPNGVELVCENPYEHCIIEFDLNRFNQVISNFLNNAIKFTTKGRITMGYKQVEGGIYFHVSDTGIGIAKENIERIFSRFEQVDNFTQGTGLGITICKAIIDKVGGKIGVHSVEGEGTTFWCIVPCEPIVTLKKETANLLQESPESKGLPLQEERSKRATILVAEDNPSNFILIRSILQNHYNITHAENGLIAVEKLMAGNFDVVLMDMKMPILNGLEASRRIRQFNTTIPIIAVTAHAFDSDREAALEAGCNDYLTKPIKQNLLFETLKRYC